MNSVTKDIFPVYTLPILKDRYFIDDKEDANGMIVRVANAVSKHQPERMRGFCLLMKELRFLPNSPTLMNAGRENGQLAACFVLPVEDTMEGIFDALKWQSLIHKSGGGTGFNFSKLRSKGSPVGSTKGVASGPVSFMSMFNLSTDVVQQGGMRRGANMGILNCDHPDILDFIKAKTQEGRLSNFNISVGVTDEFMARVFEGEEKAKAIWEAIVESAWATGDPGLVFLDRINEDNPTPHLGRLEATNPCGESPLLPFEACNLGSINLARHVSNGIVEWNKLRDTVRTAVRFLDSIIDVNLYPLPQIDQAVKRTRKIGLGVMGWAEMLMLMNIPYDSDQAVKVAQKVGSFIRDEAHEMSRGLAEEFGVYPAWREGDDKRRNATLTCIAPTGTIGLLAGTTQGIEPAFALETRRKVFVGEENEHEITVPLEAWERAGKPAGDPIFKTAHKIAPIWHVRHQAAWQESTDLAVSKTINLPNEASIADVAKCYLDAYEYGCKGVTVYRDGCKSSQVLYSGAEKRRAKPTTRESILEGRTIKTPSPFGNIYVTVNQQDGKPYEVFATLGRSGADIAANCEGYGRLGSLALQHGASLEAVSNQLVGIKGSGIVITDEGGMVTSIPDAIGQALGRMTDAKPKREIETCPQCGGAVIFREGCQSCDSCGWSRCSG